MEPEAFRSSGFDGKMSVTLQRLIRGKYVTADGEEMQICEETSRP